MVGKDQRPLTYLTVILSFEAYSASAAERSQRMKKKLTPVEMVSIFRSFTP